VRVCVFVCVYVYVCVCVFVRLQHACQAVGALKIAAQTAAAAHIDRHWMCHYVLCLL